MPKRSTMPYENMDWQSLAGEMAAKPRDVHFPKEDNRQYWGALIREAGSSVVKGLEEGQRRKEARAKQQYEQEKDERRASEERTVTEISNVWKKVGLGFKLSPEEAAKINVSPEEAQELAEAKAAKAVKQPKEYVVGSAFDIPTKTFHKIIAREHPDGSVITQDITHKVDFIPQHIIEARAKRFEDWNEDEKRQYDQANKEIESRMKLLVDRRKNPIAARSKAVNEYLKQAKLKLSPRVQQALLAGGFEPDVAPQDTRPSVPPPAGMEIIPE